MSADPTIPTRLFRANSPSDIACASIVADVLPPGRNILALSTDKASAELEGYRECYRGLAALHPWAAVVDLSGIPLVTQFDQERTPWRRVLGIALMRASIRDLRSRLAGVLGASPTAPDLEGRVDRGFDELYLTCPHHPDVLALCRVLPGARKLYYPHTFDSLSRSELGYYEPFCSGRPLPRRTALFNAVKQALWGADAVPLLRVTIDAAYTFKLPFPWAGEQHRLDDRIDEATMKGLFARLPAPVQDDYRRLALACRPPVGVLLLNADSDPRFAPAELDAYRHLGEVLARRCEGGTILVKMHSRGSLADSRRVVDTLRGSFPAVDVVPVEHHHFYPIEIVLAPFGAVACAGLGTTALRTLRMIYGMEAYCATDRLRVLYRDDAGWHDGCLRWIDEYADDVISV